MNDISERFEEETSEINLSAIDANIMELAQKIKDCVDGEEVEELDEYEERYHDEGSDNEEE